MSPVFLDTVGLIAVWDETDQWHSGAAPVYSRLLRERRVLVTTSYVLAECANASARRIFRGAVIELQESLELFGWLIFPGEEDWRRASRAYAAGSSGGPGLVDHLSFAVIRRSGLHEVFTNDRHFRAAGFEPLS